MNRNVTADEMRSQGTDGQSSFSDVQLASVGVRHSCVDVPALLRPIHRTDRLVMLGSCFAQYMAERMQQEGFEVLANPLGTLFNPFSIAQTVEAALNVDRISLPLFPADGGWRCWWANTRFMAATPKELDEQLRNQLRTLREALLKAQHLVITLGTNVYYTISSVPLWMNGAPEAQKNEEDKTQKNAKIVVTNCQRQPDYLFDERRAGMFKVETSLGRMVEQLKDVNPELQIILTVSPYRYHKYGYHGSQLSKATLLLAEDELIYDYPETCCYFPAYELLLDELRDYKYYAPDGHHPGPVAIDFIWSRFAMLIED